MLRVCSTVLDTAQSVSRRKRNGARINSRTEETVSPGPDFVMWPLGFGQQLPVGHQLLEELEARRAAALNTGKDCRPASEVSYHEKAPIGKVLAGEIEI